MSNAERSEEHTSSVCVKVIKGENYQVNICDKELIGKKLNDNTINEHFYGTEATREEIIKELKLATLINALGAKAVDLLKEVKGELQVVLIEGVPHAQVFTIP